MRRGFRMGLLLLLLPSNRAFAQWDDGLLKPFVMDHRAGGASPADVSFLLDAPAGKDGFIRIHDGHFVEPGGRRIDFWGVHLTDWSRGSILLPVRPTPTTRTFTHSTPCRDPTGPGWSFR